MEKILALALAFVIILPNIAIAREPLLVPAEQTASLRIEQALTKEGTKEIVADIIVNPNGQSINAVFIGIDFATSSLAATSLAFDNSFCELFIDQSYDNEVGRISIMCGKPYPGIETEAVVGRITFEKIDNNATNINLSSSSMVLANDGYGTDVLATTTPLSIQ